MNNYFKWLKINPDKYIKLKRDFGQDLKNYVNYRLKIGAPLSRKQGMVGVRQFFYYYDIEIKPNIKKYIKRKYNAVEPSTNDKILENDESANLIRLRKSGPIYQGEIEIKVSNYLTIKDFNKTKNNIVK